MVSVVAGPNGKKGEPKGALGVPILGGFHLSKLKSQGLCKYGLCSGLAKERCGVVDMVCAFQWLQPLPVQGIVGCRIVLF